MVSFDVSGAADTPDDGTEAPAAPTRRERAGAWWRAADARRRRRTVLLAVGGVVVLVGAAVVVDQERDRRAYAALLAAPGGVASLEGEPVEVWDAPVDSLAALLPDGVLATVAGNRLTAVDVATGSERWRLDLGDGLTCGPRPSPAAPMDWVTPASILTCLHGPDDARTVTVLDADGQVVGERDLDGGGDARRSLVPGADGTLVVAELDGDLPAHVDFATVDEVFAELPRVLQDSVVASLRVEDALTGEVRLDVPMTAAVGQQLVDCYAVEPAVPDPEGPGAAIRADLVLPEPVASTSTVSFSGCGWTAASTRDGTDLGGIASLGALWFLGDPRQAAPGGFVALTDDGSVLLDHSGDVVQEAPEVVLQVPSASDGTGDGLHLGTAGAADVVALTGESERWRAPVPEARVLVRTGAQVVVGSWQQLVALDADDGTELWRYADRDHGWLPVSAVTDGARMTAGVVETDETGALEPVLLTVDLATGERTRTPSSVGSVAWPVAVEGTLVVLDLAPVDRSPGFEVVGVQVLAAS